MTPDSSGGNCSGGSVNIYFPHIASDHSWETEICMINTGSQAVTGELKAYNNSGQEIDSTCISLNPKARREMIVGNELSNAGQIGYAVFSSDSQSVKGYLKFYIRQLHL